MTFLGLTIGEWATLIALITSMFSGLIFLFRSIIINPLSANMKSLENVIDSFRLDLEESKKDRGVLHIRINKLDTRVTVLEEHDKWEGERR
ncbi:hypothetical protein AB6819_11825 [Carnobacterium maltaromaticum]|uniref:hypothetical protein n=1 Tax=Carnobacterium maltaromaticum TaxID=2751 RepID=UPI0009C88E10|nr:hypothetical protein [Carnobacterium maltaromaticum]MBC9787163.1 hypothetical protein [Carnobacterium maltaromaticum]CRH23049.1 conserved hypothetical protein [Carnobacterium maltaromaticum]